MSDKPTLDRADARVRHDDSLKGALKEFADRLRSGDLGMLPVIVGLVLISVVFSSLNPVFLAPNNLVNLLFDCATVGVISLGIVCVLMLGEIDLSVGSMSGVASALIGVIWVKLGAPLPLAIMAALALGALMGALYATLRTRLGMPSFVSTLSGLMALLGLQLYLLGSTGSINLPYGSWMVSFGQLLIMPDWLSHTLALVPGAVLLILGMRTNDRRRQANLSAGSLGGLLLKVAADGRQILVEQLLERDHLPVRLHRHGAVSWRVR